MAILVTGGAGYIGSHMALELLDAGEKVVVLDNLSTGFREAVLGAELVVGDTADERDRWRELARTQIAFYGSTPNYAFIFDDLDHPGTTAKLRDHQKAGDLAGMTAVITDDILRHFATEGTWATTADAIADRYAGLATRAVNYFGTIAWTENPQHLARWRPIADALRDIP